MNRRRLVGHAFRARKPDCLAAGTAVRKRLDARRCCSGAGIQGGRAGNYSGASASLAARRDVSPGIQKNAGLGGRLRPRLSSFRACSRRKFLRYGSNAHRVGSIGRPRPFVRAPACLWALRSTRGLCLPKRKGLIMRQTTNAQRDGTRGEQRAQPALVRGR